MILDNHNHQVKDPTYWQKVDLPVKKEFPPTKTEDKPGVYATDFPTTKFKWYKDPETGACRSTSVFWVSEKIKNISGISFRGSIKKENLGVRSNEFAVFFHEKQHYGGGYEYGWVFPENSHKGYFYLLKDANLKHQKWAQWPDDLKTTDDSQAVKEAIKKTGDYQYWNVKILKSGDFRLEMMNPDTWETRKCTIKKPDWLPNLAGKDGYITICAQKRADPTVSPTPSIYIDSVKVWK